LAGKKDRGKAMPELGGASEESVSASTRAATSASELQYRSAQLQNGSDAAYGACHCDQHIDSGDSKMRVFLEPKEATVTLARLTEFGAIMADKSSKF
jgi:hypothetical protein